MKKSTIHKPYYKNSDRPALEKAIQQALNQNAFSLAYQPIFNLQTKAISSVEVLLRWQDKKYDMLSLKDVISIAEESSLIHPLGDWIFETAFEQFVKWQKQNHLLSLCINLSPVQLLHENFLTKLHHLLKSYQIPATSLEFEITESVIMSEDTMSHTVWEQLHELGASLSVDDFGTAYFSLSRLKRLPINTLKIDVSFIQDIVTDQDDAVIVDLMIMLAKRLHLKLVAEGIESKEQLKFLIDNGCSFGQGFYFTKPLDAASISNFLGEHM